MFFNNMQLSMCEAKQQFFSKKTGQSIIAFAYHPPFVVYIIDLSRGISLIRGFCHHYLVVFVPNSWNSDYSIKLKMVCQQFFKNFLIFFEIFLKLPFDRRFGTKREHMIHLFFTFVNK